MSKSISKYWFCTFFAFVLLFGAGIVSAETLAISGGFAIDTKTKRVVVVPQTAKEVGSLTQLLDNAGFENGSLSPWNSANWSVTTTSPNSGQYCATDVGNYSIEQDIAPVPVADVVSVKLWSRQPEPTIQAVYMLYSDNSDSGNIIYPTDTWQLFDVTSFLTPGKTLVGIKIWGYSGGGSAPDVTYIDDVSIEIASSALAIDVIPNQLSFVPGDTLDVRTLITNDSTPDTVIKMLWVEFPSGAKWSHSRTPDVNVPANASIGAPMLSYTFGSGDAAGEYKIGGLLEDNVTGEDISVDIETITFTNP